MQKRSALLLIMFIATTLSSELLLPARAAARATEKPAPRTAVRSASRSRTMEAQVCVKCAAAQAAAAGKTRTKLSMLPTPGHCPNLTDVISKYVPPQDVHCYESLFFYESTCDYTSSTKKGAFGNGEAGYGLCALERYHDNRIKEHKRGPDCEKIATPDEQVKCCVSIMRKTRGRYFGTVITSHVTPRCN